MVWTVVNILGKNKFEKRCLFYLHVVRFLSVLEVNLEVYDAVKHGTGDKSDRAAFGQRRFRERALVTVCPIRGPRYRTPNARLCGQGKKVFAGPEDISAQNRRDRVGQSVC